MIGAILMFGWLSSILGFGKPAPERVVHQIRAKYENAQSTDENARQWALIDYLSAKSSNTFQVRRQLRFRSRYEVSNNPYLFGICNSNADDLINTGPTLKCLTPSDAANRRIETVFQTWADEIDLVEKLRTIKLAKTVDGEGFLVLKTVSDLTHPVKLYPIDVEADQVTAAMSKNIEDTWLDGIEVHPVTGRPVSYTMLRSHPGDLVYQGLNPLGSDRIKAKYVLHWFQKFRPGQIRGVPAFTSALDLFGEQRAYRKATLTKANTAANLTAVIETEGPADADGSLTPEPFEHVPIDRGTAMTLPGNAKMHQYDTGEPAATYEMFQERCLAEACRPLSYPLNLALGTSMKFNFSSARLDHINYRNGLIVERAECDRLILNLLLAAFIEEAMLIPGLLPRGIASILDVPHEWHWPGFEPLDPVADAKADHERLSNGTLTYEKFWASRGYDWRVVMAQQAKEQAEIKRLELIFGDPIKKTEQLTPKTAEAGSVA
jgi:capsid protein